MRGIKYQEFKRIKNGNKKLRKKFHDVEHSKHAMVYWSIFGALYSLSFFDTFRSNNFRRDGVTILSEWKDDGNKIDKLQEIFESITTFLKLASKY